MSASRPITTTNDNSEGQVVIDWTQVSQDTIKYNTDDEEETMRAKAKERKRQKAAEQACQEEQAWLEAERSGRGPRPEREAEEKKAYNEERWEAETSKGDEAGTGGTGGEAGGEVKWVVMDPVCTCCAWAKVVCEFLVDGNKKSVACMCCNLSKGKDAKASPKARRVNKGKKWKADEENAEARPSKQKWAKMSARPTKVLDLDEPEASRSRLRETGADKYLGLEDKLRCLIDMVGLIANNLASLFKLHETAVENSGCITDALKSLLDKSYSFRMAVSPSDLGSSELDSKELHKEAK
ncbi:hypothetical protein M404DRAFT_29429 [Pisolithus tinctorius Marx 270]|uniref:Uncharacterized protein n=1 Tax=Pisolithus tinctorius Marx 270 TaxID=870435 RepID=A0A0C3IUH5_PISTI|nr:hypothetical protein M404DRAFT_29429 [Pisolithus tinctorius Marx 270]